MLKLILFTFLSVANATEPSPGEAAGYTKVVGSDTDGLFTNYVDATANGLKVDIGAATVTCDAGTGVATEATLATLATNAQLIELEQTVLDLADGVTQNQIYTRLGSIMTNTQNTAISTQNIDNNIPSGLTVTAGRLQAEIPLPSGASTAALQNTGNGYLFNIDAIGTSSNTYLNNINTKIIALTPTQNSTTSGQLGPLVQGATTTSAPSYTTGRTNPISLNTAGGLRVDGSGVTQPISASSLPLPSGAATDASLGTINTTLGTPFQAGGSIGNTTFACTQSGTFTVQPGNTANTTAWKVDGSAVTQPISASALPLPTLAATSTNQSTEIASLASIDGKLTSGVTVTGALTDTQLRASAVPVSLATLPALAAGSAVIGHVIADSGSTTVVTGNVASTVADGANVTLGAKADAKSAATDTTAITEMQVLKEISFMEQNPASQAVTNAGTFAVQATLGAETTKVIGTVNQGTSPWVISGALTDTQLRASAVPVSLATAPALVAGSAIIGKVGIDQTTPGTTNGVQVNAALPAGSNVIGHVIADSGSTTAVTGNVANTVADGANVTLGAKADAKSTATDTTAVTIMSVLKEISAMEQAPASRAVTNAGTFAVQAAESDGANITLGAKADAKSTATDTTAVSIMSVLKQISASVQAPPTQAVTATLGTETTKVIGTVNISAAQTVTGLSDGTNTAKVQAASTAPAAADKALTVVQSPNGGNPCMNSGSTLVSITGATSGTSNVQIIALSGSTKIYICSLTVIGVSGTTPTFSLVSGTGSNCASTAATVLQAWTTAAGTLYAFANPLAVVASGSALCYKGTGTSPVQNYALTYVQQ